MLTQKFRYLLEEYQRKKWFPDTYPDPYGELIDSLTVSRLLAFSDAQDRASLATAFFLSRDLPKIHSPESWKDMQRAAGKSLHRPEIHPDSVFYFIRALEEAASRELWKEFRDWTETWRTVLESWLRTRLEIENQLQKLETGFLKTLKIDSGLKSKSIQDSLNASRDFFGWQLQQQSPVETLPELQRFFRWKNWDSVADWNNFRALGNNLADTYGVKKLPRLKRDESSKSIQQLFPIVPPARVQLRYGKAAGPADALRFAVEFGKGCFFAGMNPKLNIEDRVCGDPSLPYFWGFLCAHPFTTAAGLNRLVGPQADSFAEPARLLFQFWYRYDAMLACYRHRVPPALKEAKDIYVDSWESAFTLEVPHFLYLYDLDRSGEALFRTIGLEAAFAAATHLTMQYGRRWFSNAKFTRRAREYCWEGYRLTLSEVLADLNVEVPSSYPFLS